MRRHKMVLEVDFLVADEDDVESCAEAVADEIVGIDGNNDAGALVMDVRIVSFDKEPLPQTKEEIAENKADEEAELARVAEVNAFIERRTLGVQIVVEDQLGNGISRRAARRPIVSNLGARRT